MTHTHARTHTEEPTKAHTRTPARTQTQRQYHPNFAHKQIRTADN